MTGQRQKGRNYAGFTLIELMIVVSIIGILAAIALPKFAELVRKSKEGSTKGNLGALRSALNIYYGDMEGVPPSDLASLTLGGKYISTIPQATVANYHDPASSIGGEIFMCLGPPPCAAMAPAPGYLALDDGGWGHNPDSVKVIVSCTHTDSRGGSWSQF